MEIDLFEITNSDLDNIVKIDNLDILPEEIPEKLRQKLYDFLTENNAVEEYVKNFDKDRWLIFFHTSDPGPLSKCINLAFDWHETLSGHSFWCRIYDKAIVLEKKIKFGDIEWK